MTNAFEHRRQEVQQIIKNASDQLNQEGVDARNYVEQIDRLHFADDTDVHVLSEIYEDLLKKVAGDSAGYAGEFYSQRHIVRAMVQVVRPRIGERVYDPCFGTAGFLGEVAEHLRAAGNLSGDQYRQRQQETFFGAELKPLTYLLGAMNMIPHGIEGANLAKGGRAAVIVPEGVLFRGGPDQKVRKALLEGFRVHSILLLPAGCFLPYTGVKTNVIFFDRPEQHSTTESVWYYELTNDGFELKQTRKPIDGNQIPDFLAKWQDRLEGDNAWTVPIADIIERGYDLSARNPNRQYDYEHRPALELVQSIKAKEQRILELLDELEGMLQ